MEVGLGSLALGRVEQLGLRPLHVAVAGDGVALPVLCLLLLNEEKIVPSKSLLCINTERLGTLPGSHHPIGICRSTCQRWVPQSGFRLQRSSRTGWSTLPSERA